MGRDWLNEMVQILIAAGIRAGEAFPARPQMALTGTVAAVGLRDLEWRTGMAEFEIRILSPRTLGGWACQTTAAAAVEALEDAGAECRMEPMAYKNTMDCMEMVILARKQIREITQEEPEAPTQPEEPEQEEQVREIQVTLGDQTASYVTLFSAEQTRGRRLVRSLNGGGAVGITPGIGGWEVKLVQVLPLGETGLTEGEEPFTLTMVADGVQQVFSGCCWNRVKQQVEQKQTKLEWEGFALSREVTEIG